MAIRPQYIVTSILLVVATLLPTAVAADGLPATATVLDNKVIMYMRPVPLVSPNGQYVAYVNRGWVCVAEIEAGTSRRLVEVPDVWSHVLASLPGTEDGGDADSLTHLLKADKRKAPVQAEIRSFEWTADSQAVVFGVHSYDDDKKTAQVHIWRAPLVGEPQEIASSEHPLTTRRWPGDMLTRDGRFLVGNFGRRRALIWDVATNKPRATPFLYLAPSPTSGRWIGVEKDTRQLVVVDEGFKIIERYEEILPENQYGSFDMIWSPDERFVLWRQQIGFDYYSNWVGCRFDLDSGERQIFTGDYMKEKIMFTGHRGEFLRVGAGNRSGVIGELYNEAYIGLVPDGRVHLRRLWYQREDAQKVLSGERWLGRSSVVTWSPNLELFTVGLPRQEGPFGEVMHLADRQRHLWKLPGDDSGRYVSPYHVAGFALDGKSIIAYDDACLFALPVTAIQTPGNKVR